MIALAHPRRSPADERGSALVQVMVAASVLLTIGYFAMASLRAPHLAARSAVSIQGISFVRQSILNNLSHDYAWAQTIAANPSMACLKPGSGATCTPDGSLIEVRSADPNEKPVVQTAPNMGFTWEGIPCDKFDATNGNDLCPLRFEVTWSCASGANACEPTGAEVPVPRFPRVSVTAKLIYKPASGSSAPPLNPGYFTVNQFFRTGSSATDTADANGVSANTQGNASVTAPVACTSIGGYFDSNSRTCESVRLTSAQGFCDPNTQVFRGVNPATGQPDCETGPALIGTCPHGTAVVGINTDGSLICSGF